MLRSVRSLVLGGLVFAVAVGCGSKDPSGFGDWEKSSDPNDPANGGKFGGDGTGETLVLDPKNATVIIDSTTSPPTPGTVTYRVLNGSDDLTSSATLTLRDATIGSFNGAVFTSLADLPEGTLGKSTIVTADTSAGKAAGTLTVVKLRKSGDQRDFFFVVPYNEAPTPENDVLKFSTNIKMADVAFVMDTTGSMQSSIDNLKNALKGSLFAQLQTAIPNVGLAVVDHRDFTDGNAVLSLRQVITTNLTLAQNAVGQMSAGGGGDLPEAQIAAMQFTLTGQANSPIPAHTPATPGTFGGVDFRPGSVPIVVEITDAEWHDPSGNASMTTLKAAFAAANAKFVNVASANGPEGQANDLSDATSSNVPSSAFGGSCASGSGPCCTGVNGAGRAADGPGGSCRLNFKADSGGNGVSSGIVNAIQAISVGSTFDVSAVPENDPANANGVDATKFIKALRAKDEGDATNGCPAAPAKDTDGDGIKDTFIAVKAGTPVCFEVVPNMNTTVPPAENPQFYNAFINVIGAPGNIQLDRRSVLFLVPPDVNVK